ncbi:sulfurtransferase [Corynebacterium xerosis]|uniref:sulfurtransferase n=1 Tax=Corynebacterium xerosis TaxID=1725 RepID=UPI000EAFB6B7|nr:sulfurtransferase [Corynebacterium xerosis]AYJ33796.1 sulfurtransferase [Corynebacterium xerosis]
MAAPHDPHPQFQQYAHPERLVSSNWLAARLGSPGLRIVESDEDMLLYDIGHIPGAVRIDWHTDLNDPTVRDYVDAEAFAELMRSKGISRDDTVVVYGDKSNWWAAYTLWVFELFGHPDVRLLNGGRDAWMTEERDTSFEVPEYPRSDYPVVERDDHTLRAYAADARELMGKGNLIDVRTPEEYSGNRTHMVDYPQEGVLRGGHIPTAVNVPWNQSVHPNSRFRSREELDAIYSDVQAGDDTIVYCRIGERSAHTWFVLHHLLGHENVRNYDGSWVEWGNMIRTPIARGMEPGDAPAT